MDKLTAKILAHKGFSYYQQGNSDKYFCRRYKTGICRAYITVKNNQVEEHGKHKCDVSDTNLVRREKVMDDIVRLSLTPNDPVARIMERAEKRYY